MPCILRRLLALTLPAAEHLQSIRACRSAAVAARLRRMSLRFLRAGAGAVHGGGDGPAAVVTLAEAQRAITVSTAAARDAVPLASLLAVGVTVHVGAGTFDRAATPFSSAYHSHPLLAFAAAAFGLTRKRALLLPQQQQQQQLKHKPSTAPVPPPRRACPSTADTTGTAHALHPLPPSTTKRTRTTTSNPRSTPRGGSCPPAPPSRASRCTTATLASLNVGLSVVEAGKARAAAAAAATRTRRRRRRTRRAARWIFPR